MLTAIEMSRILTEHDEEKKQAMIDEISDKDLASLENDLAALHKEVEKQKERREKRRKSE